MDWYFSSRNTSKYLYLLPLKKQEISLVSSLDSNAMYLI